MLRSVIILILEKDKKLRQSVQVSFYCQFIANGDIVIFDIISSFGLIPNEERRFNTVFEST